MTTITLKPLLHRGGENIAILAPNEPNLNLVIRKLPKVKWSQSNRCWYIPFSQGAQMLLEQAFKSVALIESTSLGKYTGKRSEVVKTLVVQKSTTQVQRSVPIAVSPAWKLSEENLAALQRFMDQLKLKAYSATAMSFCSYYSC